MEVDFQQVKYGFEAAKSAIEAVKSFLADSRKTATTPEDIDKNIALAERELKLAEAQIASGLGYELCRAHFPPVPMLKDRVDKRYVETIYRCPECNREEPSPEYFEQRLRIDQQVDRRRQSRSTQSKYA